MEEQQITFDTLNNDCMISIFEHLEVKKKIEIERVCKRWNQVSKLSWSKNNNFNVTQYIPYEIDENRKFALTNFLIKILKRSHNHLKSLRLDFYEQYTKKVEILQFLKAIPKYCNNLINLEIYKSTENVYNDTNLRHIFSCNVNLEKIEFNFLSLNGDCLMHLHANKIKYLSLSLCKFKSKQCLYKFVSNLKNLEEIKLWERDENFNIMIEALVASKCENVSKVSLMKERGRSFSENISLFLSNQKNLSQLHLKEVMIDEKLMSSTPAKYLREIDFHIYDFESAKNFTNLIYYFKNLENLKCYFEILDFRHWQQLINSINEGIKEIKIYFRKYSRKKEEPFYFSNRLKYLESFEIYYFDRWFDNKSLILDNMFEGLTNCNNLRKIAIKNYKFKNFGINSFPNLESLSITGNDLLKDNACIEIIETSLKLKRLELYECPRVREEIIEKASKVKVKRGDNHALKLVLIDCYMDEYFEDDFPLIIYRIRNH